jgi:intracellular sulfur oxidation DsrE/DsrF family protein
MRAIRFALVVAAIAAVTAGCASTSGPQAAGGKRGVVIQVSDGDPKTWNQALNVVRNVQQAYGKDKVDVEMVVFGNGIGMLQFDSPLASRVEDTLASGANVSMCENTMRGRKVTRKDMLPRIGYVKAGVIEIIDKQGQGWVVVRP